MFELGFGKEKAEGKNMLKVLMLTIHRDLREALISPDELHY